MQNMTIHINPESVQIETVKEGKKSIKNTNLRALQEVLTRGDRTETPLLPGAWGVQKYMKINNREFYAYTTPQFVTPTKYDYRPEGGGGITNYKIITPAALWLFAIEHNPSRDQRRYVHGVVYAIKNPILSENDQLYKFPFSNTNSRYICWGGGSSSFPQLSGSKSIQTIPDRFFANPFNNDLDGSKFNEFEEKVSGRTIRRFRTSHLLESLDKRCKEAEKKGETPVFPNEILRRRDHTFKTAVENFTDQYLR